MLLVHLSVDTFILSSCFSPLLNDLNYEIRIFTGPQKLKVAEVMGFTVVPIMKNQMEQGFSFNASKMGFQL